MQEDSNQKIPGTAEQESPFVTNQEFGELCKHFEGVVRSLYGLDEKSNPYFKISHEEGFRSYADELDVIRSLRNLYSHAETRIDGKDAYLISRVTYRTLEKIVDKLENPPTVENYYISHPICVRTGDRIRYVIHLMQKSRISQVPVLDQSDRVIAVFSENSVFSRIGRDEVLDPGSRLSEVIEDLRLNNHDGETFDFISLHTPVSRARDLFSRRRDKKRLKMLLVTENGTANEKLLGILTPWDIID